MRYWELVENYTFTSLGLYDPSQDEIHRIASNDTRKPVITLRMINRLKRQREVQKRVHDHRMELVKTMYGDEDLLQNTQNQQHEIEMAKLETERDLLKLQNEIDRAEIDLDRRATIRDKARAVADRSVRALKP